MKKAEAETTSFMLRELLEEYLDKEPDIVLKANRKITLFRKILTVKEALR